MATRTATTAPQTATQQAEAGNGAAASWFLSRYGAGNQALNEITPSKVCKGVRLVGQGLLQAPSLPFIVTATQIGVILGKITPVTAAALVCAGLLSVLIFPLLALSRVRGDQPAPAGTAAETASVPEPHLV